MTKKRLTYSLSAMAFATLIFAGASVNAGFFDRISNALDNDRPTALDDEPSAESFAVANRDDIGKIVKVSYQGAATNAGPALAPVPQRTGAPVTAPPARVSQGTVVPGSVQPQPQVRSLPPATMAPPARVISPARAYPPIGPVGPAAYSRGPMPIAGGFPLFRRVKVKDPDHIHPCAVPTIVQVLDPCPPKCGSCGPRCVYVEICAPTWRPEVKVRRDGRMVKYDYGDYKVIVTSKDGYVKVNYND